MAFDTYPNIIPVYRLRPMSPMLERMIENATAEHRADQLRGAEEAGDQAVKPASLEDGSLDLRL